MPEKDPQDIITPYAFQVSPELLGLPLASPWRRGIALGVDGLLLAVLVNSPGVLLGVAAALVLLRASGGTAVRPGRRRLSRFAGAVLLVWMVSSAWGALTDRRGGTDRSPAEAGVITGMDGARLAGDLLALRQAGSPEHAQRRAERLLARLEGHGLTEAELAELLETAAAGASPWVRAAVDSALARRGVTPEPRTGSADPDPVAALAQAYLSARAAGDTAEAGAYARELTAVLAADTLAAVAARADQVQAALARLETAATTTRRSRTRGIVEWFRQLTRDLGLGVGWAALYFTAFTVLWQGRTPGKRLLGIRVVRLSGQPLGWWAAFGRFGGYSAGLATGLIGFLQVFWDPNRQAIHDKIVQTVVIRG